MDASQTANILYAQLCVGMLAMGFVLFCCRYLWLAITDKVK